MSEQLIKQMPNQIYLNGIIQLFFTLQLSNKLYHWNTSSFSRHKATDKLDTQLSKIIDNFIEVFIGRYNIKPQVNLINLNPFFLTDLGIVTLFEKSVKYLDKMDKQINNSELLSIRDDLVIEINTILYLFKLN